MRAKTPATPTAVAGGDIENAQRRVDSQVENKWVDLLIKSYVKVGRVADVRMPDGECMCVRACAISYTNVYACSQTGTHAH